MRAQPPLSHRNLQYAIVMAHGGRMASPTIDILRKLKWYRPDYFYFIEPIRKLNSSADDIARLRRADQYGFSMREHRIQLREQCKRLFAPSQYFTNIVHQYIPPHFSFFFSPYIRLIEYTNIKCVIILSRCFSFGFFLFYFLSSYLGAHSANDIRAWRFVSA